MTVLWTTARIGAGCLLLLAALAVAAQDSTEKKDKKKGKGPADPPGTTAYMNQLRLLFDTWDKNKDSSLDKSELAIAFRGTGAKPYDNAETKAKEKEESKSEEKKDGEKDKTSSGKEKSGKTPDYSKYPDYQFLVQLDKDRDDLISRDEFMEWAREYAIQIRDQNEAVKEAQKLQQQLGKLKPKDKNRTALEAKLKKQQQQIERLQQQAKKYEKVQKSLKK